MNRPTTTRRIHRRRHARELLMMAMFAAIAFAPCLCDAGNSDRKALRKFKKWTSGSWSTRLGKMPLLLSLPPGKGKGRGQFEATPFSSGDGMSPLLLKSKKYKLRRRGKLLVVKGLATWQRSSVSRIGGTNWSGPFAIKAKLKGRKTIIATGLITVSGTTTFSGPISTRTRGPLPSVPTPERELAFVGNAGNGPDQFSPGFYTESDGLGAVPYDFLIAKHEVTNAEYTEYLNAVAASDPNGVFNTLMQTDPRGGIVQEGMDGSFTYSTKTNMGDKPVGWVSFFDACRFCNWIHNGKPTGAQGNSTTEDGAYTLTTDSMNLNSVFRNPGAKCFIPSENEWHKAAFHEPGSGWIILSGPNYGSPSNYWLYATRHNEIPSDAVADATGNIVTSPPFDVSNIGNHNKGADWNGLDGNLTTVGSGGPGNTTFYGALDMDGNVHEWTESGIGQGYRVYRGGSWAGGGSWSSGGATSPPADDVLNGSPDNFFGFRTGAYPYD